MLILDPQQRKEMTDHASRLAPQEACGLLAGRPGKVEKIYQLANTSASPKLCYFMDPQEQLLTMKAIRQAGLELVGIYHSHPESEAYPSARDVELAFYPDVSYLIISLQKPGQFQLRSFRINAGEITEEEIT